MKHLLPVILILSGIVVQSCVDCGPQAELSARIRFNELYELDSIYALNAVSQEPITRQLTDGTPRQVDELPISLLSDTTTYIFRSGQRIDTLSIYYQRIFRYKGGCGFVTDAGEPATGRHYYSTFSKTEIDYNTYVRPGQQPWFGSNPGSGISIYILP
ncbi:hypothetical protein SAMN04487996_12833 [Dyadobacter soli]|uniref:Lipoprotein n=1 Tax=Dyadobacter soli TaxID=659014 RepID=A0A1G7ZHS7_9BACT|nr:hypothetical protein [Dyadobacter soli]SDH08165.1 hypothetical protein SAMN04487996_12833 [Dyadobacter soli]